MKTMTSVIALSACMAGLGACSGLPGTELEDTTGMAPTGSEFQNALYTDYVKLSKAEYGEGDYQASDFFAQRAQVSARGNRVVQPVTPAYAADEWEMTPARADYMRGEREKLMTLLDHGMREGYPTLAATAQTNFDCWVQEVAENRQPEDISACRDLYLSATENMGQIVAANEKPKAAMVVMKTEPETPEPAPTLAPAAGTEPARADVLVFFDWDSAQVSAQTREILDKVAENARATQANGIRLVGHADTSGSAAYNDRLSLRRAEAVEDVLKAEGLGTTTYEIEALGEEDPLVQTGDGVRNPQNRRVRIVLE